MERGDETAVEMDGVSEDVEEDGEPTAVVVAEGESVEEFEFWQVVEPANRSMRGEPVDAAFFWFQNTFGGEGLERFFHMGIVFSLFAGATKETKRIFEEAKDAEILNFEPGVQEELNAGFAAETAPFGDGVFINPGFVFGEGSGSAMVGFDLVVVAKNHDSWSDFGAKLQRFLEFEAKSGTAERKRRVEKVALENDDVGLDLR